MICENTDCYLIGEETRNFVEIDGVKSCVWCKFELTIKDNQNLEAFGEAEIVEPFDVGVLETIKDAAEAMDNQEVPTEGRMIAGINDGFEEADPPNNIVEWMEARDEINTSFIVLIGQADAIGASYMRDRLMELNREMLNLIYQEYGVAD